MSLMHTVLKAVTATAVALLTGCAPPKTPDYDAPDAAPPADAPYVVSVSPKTGAENVNRRPVFRINFDRRIDARTIETRSLTLYSGTVGRWLTSYYDPFENQLIVWPAGYLLRQSTWVMKLRSGISDMDGLPVAPGVLTSFRTGDDADFETPYHIRSFKDDILPIFENRCTSCHGGTEAIAGLRLDTEEGISETALSQPSQGRQDWDLIVPTRPGLSYFLYKLSQDKTMPGMPMPRALDDEETAMPLSKEEKQALVDWIAVGAVFFDPEASDQ
jgi:hypothetical protein